MADSITPDAISTILANPTPDSSSPLPDLVVQVVDLKPIASSRYRFEASDGKEKLPAMFKSDFVPEIQLGNLQNLGLIRVLDYTVTPNPKTKGMCMIVDKCEIVTPALGTEISSRPTKQEPHIDLKPKQDVGIQLKPKQEPEAKSAAQMLNDQNPQIDLKPKQDVGIQLKPKQEPVAKSAAQILNDQQGNMAPSARMGMTRRVYPLVSLNPYQGNWTIKVRVTSKGNLRSYRNARGEGHVFNVELTDEEGTQIQATMFNEAALKFYEKFEMGKVYYISKGTLKVANKQFKTVRNDYEMTLNENSIVEEANGEEVFVPETKFDFVPINQLGSYVNGRELVDVIGVVQSVSPTMNLKRKASNDTVSKRDITIADESKKTVVVSLWNDLADNIGQELSEAVESSPIVAIKSLKVGDYQGVSLSTLSKSTVLINPSVPESEKLKSWYNAEGKETSMEAIGAGVMAGKSTNGARTMYSDRVCISYITNNPSMGDDKPEYFSLRGCISFIKPDQNMWYRACTKCSKKVTESIGSGYWCEGCQNSYSECTLRYILVAKVSDHSGEAWLSLFNEQAERLIGYSADELNRMKNDGDEQSFLLKLKEATWVPHLFRVAVKQNEYNNEKRQRINVLAEAPLDFVAESKFLLEEISKMQAS